MQAQVHTFKHLIGANRFGDCLQLQNSRRAGGRCRHDLATLSSKQRCSLAVPHESWPMGPPARCREATVHEGGRRRGKLRNSPPRSNPKLLLLLDEVPAWLLVIAPCFRSRYRAK